MSFFQRGRAGGGRARKVTKSLYTSTASGALMTLPSSGLLEPVTASKGGGAANLTLNGATRVVSRTASVAAGTSEQISGTLTGADGCTIPFDYTLTAQSVIAAITTTVSVAAAPGTKIADLVGVPTGETATLTGAPQLALSGTGPNTDLIVGLGTLEEGAVYAGTISAPGAVSGAVSVTVQAQAATVSAPNFASASLRGFQTFSDDLSLQQFGAADAFNTSGDGSIALADNPDTGHARGKLLRINSGTGRAFMALRYRYLAHNAPCALDNSLTSTTAGHVRVSGCIPSGSGTILSGYAGDTGTAPIQTGAAQFAVGFADAGGGNSRLTVNGTPVGRSLSRTTHIDIIVSFDAAVDTLAVKTKARGEGSYTTESSGSVTAFAAITSLRIGDFYLDDYATSNSSDTEIDRHWYIAGSGCRDVRQTEALMLLVIPDNLFAGQNKARLRWAAGADPTSGSTTTAVALSGAVDNALQLPLTGLTHNTSYSYQFQILSAADAVLWTSEVYRFHTTANAGTATAKEWNVESCKIGTPLAHPYDGDQYTLDTLTQSVYRGTINLGDQHYEQGGPETMTEPYLLTRNPTTRTDFQRQLREFYSDIVQHQLFTKGATIFVPDDHQMMNDANATMAVGGINFSTPANSWPSRRGTYPAGTTCGTIWANGLATFRSHAPIVSAPHATSFYRTWTDGTTMFILLDTRTQRLVGAGAGTPKYIGDVQDTWAKALIGSAGANIPAGITEIIFLGQSGFNQFTTKTSEGWKRLAEGEFNSFMDYMIANIPSGVKWFGVTGDDHLGAALHNVLSTVNNANAPPNYKGELRASGSAATYFNPDSYYSGGQAANVLWKPTLPAQMNLGDPLPLIRASGVLLADDGAGNITANYKMTGAPASSYTVAGVPPFPLNVGTLLEYWNSNDNSKAFSDGTGVTPAVADSSDVQYLGSQSAVARSLTNANGAASPNYVTDGATHSAKVLDFTAASTQYLRSGSSSLLSALSGNDTSFVAVMRFKVSLNGSDQALWSAHTKSGASDRFIHMRCTSAGQIGVYMNDGSGVVSQVTSGTPLVDGSIHTVTMVRNGTAVSVWIDGVLTSINAATMNVGSITFEELSIGARYNDGSDNYVLPFNGSMLGITLFSQNSRDTNITDHETQLAEIWA